MLTASAVTRQFAQADATITLDETARRRRRMMMTSDRMANGAAISFLLDLPQARLLRHGDGLLLSDGRIVEVQAKPEPLLEVRGRDRRHLLALAWQIGNRHLAADIGEDRIRIRRDRVIAEMLAGLGATIAEVEAAFDPEGGAYGDAQAAHHHHGHDHDHGHDHSHHDDHGPRGHGHG
jgi:urease accessory protein